MKMIIFVKTDTFQLPLLRSNDHKRKIFKGKKSNLLHRGQVVNPRPHENNNRGRDRRGAPVKYWQQVHSTQTTSKISKFDKKVETYFSPSKMKGFNIHLGLA